MFPFAILPIVLGKHVFFELEHKIPGLKKIDSALMHTGSLAAFSLSSKNLRLFCLKTLTQNSRLKTLTKYFHQKPSPTLTQNSHQTLTQNSRQTLTKKILPKKFLLKAVTQMLLPKSLIQTLTQNSH